MNDVTTCVCLFEQRLVHSAIERLLRAALDGERGGGPARVAGAAQRHAERPRRQPRLVPQRTKSVYIYNFL